VPRFFDPWAVLGENTISPSGPPKASKAPKIDPFDGVDDRVRNVNGKTLGGLGALGGVPLSDDFSVAVRLAWGRRQNAWHMAHGERVPRWQCAGCGEPIGDRLLLDLADGNRVHLDTLACLIRWGERWRDAATCGLVAMGLEPPSEM